MSTRADCLAAADAIRAASRARRDTAYAMSGGDPAAAVTGAHSSRFTEAELAAQYQGWRDGAEAADRPGAA